MRRFAAAAVVVAVALGSGIGRPGGAAAHALRIASSPDEGAVLQQAPARVTITFGEEPDPALSHIEVLDTAGHDHTAGAPAAVAGDTRVLSVVLRSMGQGVYTVSWRTVSRVDGHRAAGAFAFGVGVTPGAVAAAGAAAGGGSGGGGPSALAVAGRFLLYLGVVGLLGAALAVVAVFRAPSWGAWPLAAGGLLAALAGTALVLGSQAADAGLGAADVWRSSLGRSLLWRGLALALAVAAVLAARLAPPARRRAGFAAGGVAGAAVVLTDVVQGHAAAQSPALLNVVLQWLHGVTAGLWVGGLVALLVGLRGLEGGQRSVAARRFSAAALVALAVVAATGVVRAIVELPSWSAMAHSGFGQLVILKSGLLVLLLGFGALHRRRTVPLAAVRPRRLRVLGSGELAVAMGAFLAAAGLVNAAPPVVAATSSAGAPASVVARGSDVATTVRLELSATPGTPGFDDFSARVTDYGSGAPIAARDVVLHFSLPLLPDLGASSLTLRADDGGGFRARGANLAVDGAWVVDALVENGAASAEVPLVVETRLDPGPRIDVSRISGEPTLYTVHLDAGRTVQVYVDPPGPGKATVHTTFFDAAGRGLAVSAAAVVATAAGGTPAALPVHQLELGHFGADGTLERAAYRFDITALVPGGERLVTHIDIPIGT